MIYLDYNASTPIDPRVCAAMQPFLTEHFGNPSAGHAFGKRMRLAIDESRAQVARMIHADPGEIVFTSGGTEGLNTVIKGVAATFGRQGGHIVTSAIEHPAVAEPIAFLERAGYRVSRVPVNAGGVVDPLAVINAVHKDTILVAVMLANNEVGTIQPIAEIGEHLRETDALFLSDAAQACGKIAIDVKALGVDFLAMAGHKFYAPAGIGALYIRSGIEIEPLMHGAGHEGGRRSGTEPVASIVGLGTAAQLAVEELHPEAVASLRDDLWEGLHRGLGDRVTCNGDHDHRLPNTLNVSFLGLRGSDLLAGVPEICATTGAACHDRSDRPSGVFQAMGLSADRARGAVRLSVGRFTTASEISRAVEMLVHAAREVGARLA